MMRLDDGGLATAGPSTSCPWCLTGTVNDNWLPRALHLRRRPAWTLTRSSPPAAATGEAAGTAAALAAGLARVASRACPGALQEHLRRQGVLMTGASPAEAARRPVVGRGPQRGLGVLGPVRLGGGSARSRGARRRRRGVVAESPCPVPGCNLCRYPRVLLDRAPVRDGPGAAWDATPSSLDGRRARENHDAVPVVRALPLCMPLVAGSPRRRGADPRPCSGSFPRQYTTWRGPVGRPVLCAEQGDPDQFDDTAKASSASPTTKP